MDHTDKLRAERGDPCGVGQIIVQSGFLMMAAPRDMPLSALSRPAAERPAPTPRQWDGESKLLAAIGL